MKDKESRNRLDLLEKLVGNRIPKPSQCSLYTFWSLASLDSVEGSGLVKEIEDIRNYLGIDYVITPQKTELVKIKKGATK